MTYFSSSLTTGDKKKASEHNGWQRNTGKGTGTGTNRQITRKSKKWRKATEGLQQKEADNGVERLWSL